MNVLRRESAGGPDRTLQATDARSGLRWLYGVLVVTIAGLGAISGELAHDADRAKGLARLAAYQACAQAHLRNFAGEEAAGDAARDVEGFLAASDAYQRCIAPMQYRLAEWMIAGAAAGLLSASGLSGAFVIVGPYPRILDTGCDYAAGASVTACR